MRKFVITVAVAISPTCCNAQGFFQTGNQLYNVCFESGELVKNDAYMYVVGVQDTLQMMFNAGKLKQTICVPPQATVQQIGDVACNYIYAHPESRHFSGEAIVTVALGQAFPCNSSAH